MLMLQNIQRTIGLIQAGYPLQQTEHHQDTSTPTPPNVPVATAAYKTKPKQ